LPISDSLLTGRRCLVLDDEFLIALDIQQILELAGAKHVASVATASEAIALLRREPKFDLAVLDLKLGGSEDNSLGVASELARMGTPFVFLTGMRVDNVHVREFRRRRSSRSLMMLWRFSTPCSVPSKTRRHRDF
jgi:CheY-like chemotaxis protein